MNHRASVALLLSAACAAQPPSLSPDAGPTPAPAVSGEGVITGAALGFALGSEVHVFVADSAFTAAAWQRLARPALGPSGPDSLSAAWARRGVVAVSADRLPARGAADLTDATVLHARGSAPARLELLRLHRPGHCTVPTPVTELVLTMPRSARTAAPEPHATVIALLHAPKTGIPARTQAPADLPSALTRRLVATAALSAESLLARRAGEPAGVPLPVGVTADRDRAADAGEAVALPGKPAHAAVGVRVRFLAATGDTVLVSGVAVVDTSGRDIDWVFGPIRAPLTRGLARTGGRFSLRAVVPGPPPLLLVQQITDVSAAGSRYLAIDAHQRSVTATRPLALRCP